MTNSRISPQQEIAPPPICLSIHDNEQRSIIGTRGNFSVITGKAKSRKTFAVSVALAAILKQDLILQRVKGTLETGKVVLYFDTEQHDYHVLKVVKRICKLAGIEAPANLIVHALRGESTQERLAFIERCIHETPLVGLVVIDGIRDTVRDINDYREATERADDLLNWTQQLDIHILVVIHVNKGNDEIRGALGTELQNKAETVISVTVDSHDKGISVVKAENCRNKDFEPFAFGINEEGLPYLIEGWQPEQRFSLQKVGKNNKSSQNTAGVIVPSELHDDMHANILRRAFEAVSPAKYGVTCNRIKAAAQYFGYRFGDNKAKEFMIHYVNTKHLLKDAKGMYVLGPSITNTTHNDLSETSLNYLNP